MLWTGPLIGSHLPGRDLIAWTSKHHLKTLLSHFHNPLGSIPTPCYMLGSSCTDRPWIPQIHFPLSLHCIGIIWWNSPEKLYHKLYVPLELILKLSQNVSLWCHSCLIYCTVCFSRWASFDHRCTLIFHISYDWHPNHHNLHWFRTQYMVQLLLMTLTYI